MTAGKPGFRPSSSSDGNGCGRKKVPEREVDKEGEAAPGVPVKRDPAHSAGGGPVIWRSNVKIEDSSAAASQDEPAAAASAAGVTASPGGGGHVSMDHEAVECAMCGDVGFVEELRQCALCQFRWQHLYCCVQPNPQGVVVWATGSPSPFLCDWCRLAKPAIPLPPAPHKHKQQQRTSGAGTARAHNVYRPRIMPEKSSRNGKDSGPLRDIPEGSSASEGSDAMEFLVQAALDEDAKQQVKQPSAADGLESASNDVPGSDYSACDTISSTSTIDSVKGPRSSSHRHAARATAPGDTISSSSSHEGRRRGLHPEPPPSKFRDVNADDSTDAMRPAKDSAGLRSPGFNRSSTSNERSSAAPQAGPATPNRAPSNGNGTGTGTGTGGALIWMPPVKLMRGFKKSNHVVANRAPSPSQSPPSRGPLHRSESLKNLSDRKLPPKEAVLQRSESLKCCMTRRKHKVLGDINSVAQPAASTGTTPPAPSRSSDGDNNFASQLPPLKRMKISSNTSVEPAAPKGLVRRYKSLSDISC